MPQDYNRYPFSIKEAIILPDKKEDIDQVRFDEALRVSKTIDMVEKLPHGVDTMLSPHYHNGIEPSVGQWQKIAIARTLYKDAELYILDEPTSSIDAISELHIFDMLEALPKNKTVLLISHRFNTVKNADRILVIEHGELIEEGNHEALMNKNGRYYSMFTQQKESYE